MANHKRPLVIKKGLDIWVMTYGDMMSLLLTFFVLIVSFSSIQESKFQQAAMALREAFGVLASPASVLALNQPIVPHLAPREEQLVLQAVQQLERTLLAEGREDVEVEVTVTGVTFRIAAPVLFASGTGDLKPDESGVLATLAELIRKSPYQVRVEGHTDSRPISTSRYPSNWHLSAARAVAVAGQLQALGVAPERLAAVGYGEFRPLADNATEEGRARNRRVEIFLEFDRERTVGDGLPLLELEHDTAPPRVEPPLSSPVTDRLRSQRVD